MDNETRDEMNKEINGGSNQEQRSEIKSDVTEISPDEKDDAVTESVSDAEESKGDKVSDTGRADGGNTEENSLKRIRIFPIWTRIVLGVAVLSGIFQIIFTVSPDFADFFNRYPAAFLRMAFAKLTGWFSFSLAETMLMVMPFIVIALIIYVIKISKRSLREMYRLTVCLFAVLSLFLSTFVLNYSSGYRGSSLDEKLGIQRENVSAEELYNTADILLTELKALKNEVYFNYGSSSVMPYSFAEMNAHLNDAYEDLAEKYDFLPSFSSRVKQIVMSEPMTYTHISGVYSYFTGESNLNMNFPDYTLPYTAAHEMAHQRGVAREDEANFIAFLVCIESEDPYIRYSGYMNVFEYVFSALYKADNKMYAAIMAQTDSCFRDETAAYNEFFKKYQDSPVADVSDAINNTYLQIQGQTQGSKSYGMVVDLAVAFYKD